MKIKVWIYQLMPDGRIYSLRKNVSVKDNMFKVKFRKQHIAFFVPAWFIEYVKKCGQDKYLTYCVDSIQPVQTMEALLSPIEPKGWTRFFRRIEGLLGYNKQG